VRRGEIHQDRDLPDVPTLIRFLAVIGIIAGLVAGGMVALVMLVEPQQREITVTLPTLRPAP
jgi:hypothetical protein